MIDCTECKEYANLILSRGEIEADEVDKLALDRHILKGCKALATDKSFIDWLEFSIKNQIELRAENKTPFPQWNRGYLEALIDARKVYLANNK